MKKEDLQDCLGDIYCNIQQYENAIEYYDKAIHMAEEGADEHGEIRLCKRLAHACYNNRQCGKMILIILYYEKVRCV